MKKLLVLLGVLLVGVMPARADEGMWLLPYLQKLNIKEMKGMGLKLSAQEIYNANGNSLKDAIVIFGGGCTGEIVSAEGLVMTNHHCGYGTIQRLSSPERNYLENGFWAMDRGEEIPCPGMSVTFIRQMEEVTEQILPYVAAVTSEAERRAVIDERIKAIVEGALPEGSSCQAMIREFFDGNQYLLFITERYPDLRLVGAPPSSIGKFGGDTDNWMWPRHTGDFSLFRVYSDANGRPAEYNPENQPYQAPKHLTISLKGYKPGDFAMILGFPGTTVRHKTSFEINELYEVENPIRVEVRGERQELMMEDMLADPKVKLQYANKFAGSSNYWKNSMGMNRGIEKLNVLGQKRLDEAAFQTWASAGSIHRYHYQGVLDSIAAVVEAETPYDRTAGYLYEALIRGVEIIGLASPWELLLFDEKIGETFPDGLKLQELRDGAARKYKDYNPPTDRKITKRMVALVREKLPREEWPGYIEVIDSLYGGDVDRAIDDLFETSLFASQEKYEAFLADPDREKVVNDPALRFFRSTIIAMEPLVNQHGMAESNSLKMARAKRIYMAGRMERQPKRAFYPDANFTMRLTYGQVLPYRPADGVIYDYYTTLDGVIAKEDPDNAYEFTVPERLKELYAAGDYGPYGEGGKLRVCFLSNNDITGGNSGSPVLNARGELLGLAFDGNWEALSGDIVFEPDLQRTINVDIRYVLFIIDKYAGAGHLIDEMTIAR